MGFGFLRKPSLLLLALSLAAAGCSRGSAGDRSTRPGKSSASSPSNQGRPPCPQVSAGTTAPLSVDAATELSGLAASRRNPGVLWTHNDSGDTDRVFAINTFGAFLGTYRISSRPQVDWEDIAVGPGPEKGVSYVYVGDIGGNKGRNRILVYRFPEPSVEPDQEPVDVDVLGVVALPARYPHGERFDAEVLLVNPADGTVFLLTKSRTKPLQLFRYPAPDQDPGKMYTLQSVATLKLPGPPAGGDISADGGLIAVKGDRYTVLWPRSTGTPIADAMRATPCHAANSPGEAIAFSDDGALYYTVPEGRHPILSTFVLG